MSLWGKLLAVMNVLLAIGVLVLANIDWGTQQGWHYSVFRRQIAISGLPIDEKEIWDADPDEPVARELSKGALTDIFQGATGPAGGLGGDAVKTVGDELARVQAKITAEVSSEPDPAKKRIILKMYLLPLARTLAERTELRTRIDEADNATPEKLAGEPYGLAEIGRRFAEVKVNAKKGAASRREIRSNAAFLLGNLSADPDWRKRVLVVVGLEAYIEGVARQADAMMHLANDLNVAMASDRAQFEQSFATQVQLLQRESEQVYKAKQFLAELTAIHAERQKQVEGRQTEKTNAEKDLVDARSDNNKETIQLKAIQYDLFKYQQRLVEAMQKNMELEAELRRLEKNKR